MIGICDSTFILSLAKGKGKGFDIVFFIHIIPFREMCKNVHFIRFSLLGAHTKIKF